MGLYLFDFIRKKPTGCPSEREEIPLLIKSSDERAVSGSPTDNKEDQRMLSQRIEQLKHELHL